MASVRVKVVRGNQYSPTRRNPETRYIYAGWHNELIPSLSYWNPRNFQAMVSQSFDGELAARILRNLGFLPSARGSTSRGGLGALKAMARRLAQGSDALLTPDGPRGPRHEIQNGVLSLARMSGLAIVPVTFRCCSVIRLKGWDRMEIPLPFSRAVVIFGEPLLVPKASSAARMSKMRIALQEGMNGQTVESQQMIKR